MSSELQQGQKGKASELHCKAQQIKSQSCPANDSQQETTSWQRARAESSKPAEPAVQLQLLAWGKEDGVRGNGGHACAQRLAVQQVLGTRAWALAPQQKNGAIIAPSSVHQPIRPQHQDTTLHLLPPQPLPGQVWDTAASCGALMPWGAQEPRFCCGDPPGANTFTGFLTNWRAVVSRTDGPSLLLEEW